MPQSTPPLPSFQTPPVIEVVIGVLFNPLEKLSAPHTGSLWSELKPKYPQVAELPPIDPVLETWQEPLEVQVGLSAIPPLPRLWFVAEGGREIVQVQRDRFVFNWRRRTSADEYPRFPAIYGEFERTYAKFRSVVESTGESVVPRQFELTYVNFLPEAIFDGPVPFAAGVFPDLGWKQSKDRYLASPEDGSWQATFPMPDRMGRLHVSATSVRAPDSARRAARFDLLARGAGPNDKVADYRAWYEHAHEMIVRAFSDLTSPSLQRKAWGRRDD